MNILSISFFSDIWQHSTPEYLFLKSLNKKFNHNISYLVCDSVFENYCSVMINLRLKFDSSVTSKKRACKRCVSTHRFYEKNSNFKFHFLSKYLNHNDYSNADNLIKGANKDKYSDIVLYGVKIGENALFNFILSNKLSTTDKLSTLQTKEYLDLIKNSALTLFALKKILEGEKIDLITVYAPEYSINKSCVEFARGLGIKVMCLSAGHHPTEGYKYLRLCEEIPESCNYYEHKYWDNYKKTPIEESDCQSVRSFLQAAFKSKTYLNYSKKYSGKNVKDFFHIHKKYTKIILLAASSSDERNAEYLSGIKISEDKVPKSIFFKNEIEWIKHVIEIAKNKKDYFFLIRPHPREFSGVKNLDSQLAKEHYEISRNLPENVKYNFPEENISVYDFIPFIDLLLVSTSGLSYEYTFFGVPCLVNDKSHYYYPEDIIYSPSSLKEYENKIDEIINSSTDDRIMKGLYALKFMIMDFKYDGIEISDTFNVEPHKLHIKLLNRMAKLLNKNFFIKFLFNKYKIFQNLDNFMSIIDNFDSATGLYNEKFIKKMSNNYYKDFYQSDKSMYKKLLESIISNKKNFGAIEKNYIQKF